VWALATPYLPVCNTSESDSPERITEFSLISGAADATVTFWADTTSTTLSAAITASTARIEQDQQLQNYIHAGAYREAITLALQLNHPARLLSLFQSAVDSSAESPTRDSLTGNPDIDHVLQSLDEENLYMLLLRLRDWNTNARTASVSQRILYALFKSYPPSTFMELASRRNPLPGRKSSPASGLKDILQALAAYTERHYKRVEGLVDESYLLEWVLGEMDGISGVNGTNEENNDVVMLGT
jgi:U3 small nucleolar RNA-associated protein 13